MACIVLLLLFPLAKLYNAWPYAWMSALACALATMTAAVDVCVTVQLAKAESLQYSGDHWDYSWYNYEDLWKIAAPGMHAVVGFLSVPCMTLFNWSYLKSRGKPAKKIEAGLK